MSQFNVGNVVFIGLGTMGYPMAGHLHRTLSAVEGINVTVFNRTAATALKWQQEYGGNREEHLSEAVSDAQIVVTCLGGDPDVKDVLAGLNGVFSQMPAGGIVVDHSTISANLARELASRAADQGIAFIDAPVSGGQAGAQNAKLTVMAGGELSAFERVVPVLQCYAAKYRLLGTSGSGQLAKMVNQICIAGLLQGLAEGMHFGMNQGLDMDAVVDVISGGAAQSWQMDNRAQTMIHNEYDFGFAVDWMRKDLGYALEEARQRQLSLPVTALVDQFYGQVQALGGGRCDTSSLLLALQATAKIEPN